MKIGTKSLLFGAHCFFIHPIFLFVAWWRLYGFPWNPRLWIVFVVHDWGYWGKPNMDGIEGEQHPLLGARIVQSMFGEAWGEFTACHSRFYAKSAGKQFSQLCIADKLATNLTPAWLYLPLVRLTGEIKEYLKPPVAHAESFHVAIAEQNKTGIEQSDEDWFAGFRAYMNQWISENKDAACTIEDIQSEILLENSSHVP